VRRRRLPHSDIDVSRLGLGTATWGFSDPDDSVAQLRLFADAGGTLIETANVYGNGECERIIGRTLAKDLRRDNFTLATKAGLVPGKPPLRTDASKARMLAELDGSLARLQVDHVDVWLVHAWDRQVPVEETLAAIDTAVTAGKVRVAGSCNYSGWQTARAATVQQLRGVAPLSVLEVEYSLVQRGIDREVRPAAKELGLGVLPWAPLGRGVLTGKYLDGVPEAKRDSKLFQWYVRGYTVDDARVRIVRETVECARQLSTTPAAVALAWVRDRPGVCAPLVGARTVDQLSASLASESVELPNAIRERLDAVSAIPLGYPERSL
jgi:aryl-alcohol dehydrogenase-like predicted oxidoreductase